MYDMLLNRNINFLSNIQKYHVSQSVLNYLFCSMGKRELFVLLGVGQF